MLRRVLYVGLVILLLLAVPLRASSAVRNATLHALAPVLRPLSAANRTLTDDWQDLSQIPELIQQRNELQDQVVSLQRQVLADTALKQQNAVLRKEIGVTGVTQTTPKLLAQVLVQGSDPADPSVIIDAGSKQGIEVGQPAVYQGALIGRIIQASEDTATVRLITSAKSLVQAAAGAGASDGLLTGTGTATTISQLQQGIAIKVGDIVATSGLGGDLPAGILIGSIGSAVSDPSSSSQSFAVTLPYAPSGLDSFFILLTGSGS